MRDHHRHPAGRPLTPGPRRRPGRALGRALGAAGLIGVLLGGFAVQPAQAHVAIVLLVLSPKDGQSVGSDLEVVIYAQRTLGGVDQVAYTLTLDQRPIDPASGRPVAARSGQIRAGDRARVPLHDLSPGPHQLEVSYRPDLDEPMMTATAAFTVHPAPGRGWPVVPVAVGVGLAVVAGATIWWARRRRPLRAAH